MPGRDGWKTAILAVVNDNGLQMQEPPNMHCRCLLGHFLVYKRHYEDDGDDEELYVPMSKEEVIMALNKYSERKRENDIATAAFFRAQEEGERR